jgi:hypothetical protein
MTQPSTDERLILAIGRIEHALTRLERVPPVRADAPNAGDAELSGRHERLRTTVSDAILRLDRLLDAQEG